MTIFTVTLNQMLAFFLFMLLGYLLRKSGKLKEDAAGSVSTLLLTLFMPATCYRSFANHCTPQVITHKLPLILAGLGVLLACLGIGFLVSRLITKDARKREVCIFALTVSNLGYVGFPLTEAVFGEQVLFDFMVFCMPFNLFIYSFGMYLMNPARKLSLRIFTSPTILSIFVGMIVGLTGISLPAPIVSAVDAASAALGPCAMLVTGLVLAELPLKAAFTDWRSHLISFLRLVGLPLFFALCAILLRLPHHVAIFMTTVTCLPAGLNCVVFAKSFSGDSESGAKVCFLSALFGILTIPLLYALAVFLFPEAIPAIV